MKGNTRRGGDWGSKGEVVVEYPTRNHFPSRTVPVINGRLLVRHTSSKRYEYKSQHRVDIKCTCRTNHDSSLQPTSKRHRRRHTKIETCRILNLSTKCEQVEVVNAFAFEKGLALRFRFRFFGRPLLLSLFLSSLTGTAHNIMPKWFIVWHFIRYDLCVHSTRVATLVLHESATLLGHLQDLRRFRLPGSRPWIRHCALPSHRRTGQEPVHYSTASFTTMGDHLFRN